MEAGATSILLVAAAGAAATAIDLRTRRVPNALTFGTGVFGLALAAMQAGDIGIGAALAGGLIGLALMLPGYVFGATGGGDVKLLAAFGTLLGPGDTVTAFVAMAIAGGGIALALMLRRRWAGSTDRYFAYAPAVAIGALAAALT
ncbi:MAG: prepilin peptidase [Vicinamibacterales bacterium]